MSSAGTTRALERIELAAQEGAGEVDLSNLGLKVVPELPEDLRDLRSLNLSGNHLKEVTPSVWELTQLEWLDLGSNRLFELEPALSRLARLSFLDLSENYLTSLPSEIGLCTRLRELSLYRNRFVAFPAAILQLEVLQTLDFSSNRLQWLPLFDECLAHLRVLDLSNNELRDIPDDIGKLRELRVLNLANNQLISVTEITPLSQLEELYLDDNRLTEIPSEVAQLPHLFLLSAEGNLIAEMPVEFARVSGSTRRQQAKNAVRDHISGGLEKDKVYFDVVPFVFDFVLSVGGIAGTTQLIDLYYKRFRASSSVSLKFPSGTRVELKNLTRKRALQIARQHEASLKEGKTMLDLGEATGDGELQRKSNLAVQTISQIPEIELVPKIPGAPSIKFEQYYVFQGSETNVRIEGPRVKGDYVSGDNIEFHGNVTGSIVNAKSKLDNVNQTINASSALDNSTKEELNRLVEELKAELDRVPEDKHEDAEAVADTADDLVKKATKENPNRKSVQITADGMLEAAKGIAGVLPIAKRIITLILTFV